MGKSNVNMMSVFIVGLSFLTAIIFVLDSRSFLIRSFYKGRV